MEGIVIVLIGFAGVGIGAVVSYCAQIRVLEKTNDTQRRTLANSLAAEIEAYLAIVQRRQHVQAAEQVAQAYEAGMDPRFPRLTGPDETPLGQFLVFSALLPRIGELGTLAGDVAKFYTVAAGVRTTVIAGARGVFDDLSPHEKAQIIRTELAVGSDAEQLGAGLVQKLRVT